jgi:hypothetical protein
VDLQRDSGAIVLGWLTKLAVTLGVLGLISFDGVSLVVARFSAADHASSYASEAADTYRATSNVNTAYAAASAAAEAESESIPVNAFSVAQDGTVQLTVTHTAHTIWMHKIGFLDRFVTVTEKGRGAPA